MSSYITKPKPGVMLNPLHPLSKGLVGYWLFNEMAGSLANDISGNKNHGRLTNMLPNVQGSGWGGSKFGGGLQFDGVDDYVDAGNGASLDITDAITMEAWVNGKSLSSDPQSYQSIVDKSSHIYGIRYDKNSNRFYGRFTLNGVSEYPSMLYSVQENTWYHLSLTYDSNTGASNCYVNGVLTYNFTYSGTIDISVNPVCIGKTVGYFNGTIDSVRIYNRALSAAEINQLYHDPFCNLMQRTPAGLYVPAALGGLSIPVAMYHYNQMARA